MAAPQITPLPPAPQRQDAPADFITKADAHVASLVGFVTEANAQATFNDGRATASDNSAIASEASNVSSGNSASAAAGSASAALVSENNASDSADSALAAAAAAGAAAGLPAFSGNALLPLRVNAGEDGVEYADIFPDQTGNAGKVLTTDGSNKSWEDPVSDYTLISSAVASSDTFIDFVLPGGFDSYKLIFLNVTNSAETAFLLRTSNDGGSTFDSGGSDYQHSSINNSSYSTTPTGAGNQAASSISLATINQTTMNGEVSILSPDSSDRTFINWHLTSYRPTQSGMNNVSGSGNRNAIESVDAIRLLPSGGNIATGTIKLYGVS